MSIQGTERWPGRLPAVVRVVFGLIWSVDAAFKWEPAVRDHVGSYLMTAGQPSWVASYIGWWSSVIRVAPHPFGITLALAESIVALSMLTGWKVRPVCVGGAVLSLLVWSSAEGFGGPYGPGSTDVGASVAYVLIFALLWWADAGTVFGFDGWLARRRHHSMATVGSRVRLGVGAVAALASLAITGALLVASGSVSAPTDSMTPSAPSSGGQMMMPSGGQNDH